MRGEVFACMAMDMKWTVKVMGLRVGEYSRSVSRGKKMTCRLHIFLFSFFSLDCFHSCICCCWLITNFGYAWVARCPECQEEDLMKGFLVLGGWAQDEHGDYLLWPRQDCISWPSGWLGTRCGAQQGHHTGGPWKLGHFLHQEQWPRCYELRAGGVAHRSTAGHPGVHASTDCIAWRQDRDSVVKAKIMYW